jgi:hypothetical protein
LIDELILLKRLTGGIKPAEIDAIGVRLAVAFPGDGERAVREADDVRIPLRADDVLIHRNLGSQWRAETIELLGIDAPARLMTRARPGHENTLVRRDGERGVALITSFEIPIGEDFIPQRR